MKSSLYIQASTAFLVVFGAGVLSGLMVERVRTESAQAKPPCKESLSQRMSGYLADELVLTDRQIKDIQPFVNSTCDQLAEIHKEALGDASKAIEACHAAILPCWSEAQAAKLNRCERERQRFLTTECGYDSLPEEDCEH